MIMLPEIKQRRSIRKYSNQPIEADKITSLLKAAMQAPTAMNRQEWRFIVIEDRETLNDMENMSPYMTMAKRASVAILVCGDRNVNKFDGYIYIDCAAAIENILLEATHIGLGTCWCGIAPREERIENFKNYFDLPESYLPVGLVMIGYPEESKEFEDRFDLSKVSYYKK